MPSSATSPTAASGHRIAVIDDDQAVLNALGFALRLDGYEVATYAEADSLYADPEVSRADCLVIDQRLDGRRSGLSLLADLRRRGVAAPAILITTQPDAACRREAARAGVVIVEKPLMGDGLRLVIERLIRDRTGR